MLHAMHRITQLLIGREISVFATFKLLHAFIYSHSEVKNFAKDLIQVFPINEFAIRSFSHAISSYPASGAFVDKRAARENIDAMRYDNSLTYTGEALEHTVKLLENER